MGDNKNAARCQARSVSRGNNVYEVQSFSRDGETRAKNEAIQVMDVELV